MIQDIVNSPNIYNNHDVQNIQDENKINIIPHVHYNHDEIEYVERPSKHYHCGDFIVIIVVITYDFMYIGLVLYIIIFNKYYANSSVNLKLNYILILLFCNSFFRMCFLLLNLRNYYILKKNNNVLMLKIDYKNLCKFSNKYANFIVELIKIFHMLICIILVFKFIPFTHDSCKPYSRYICIIGRYFAFWGIIYFIIIGLFIIIIVLSICIYYKNYVMHIKNIRDNYIIKFVVDNTILQHIVLYNEEQCPICLDYGNINEISFVKTNCGHLFHEDCINLIIQSSQEKGQLVYCPLCLIIITPLK